MPPSSSGPFRTDVRDDPATAAGKVRRLGFRAGQTGTDRHQRPFHAAIVPGSCIHPATSPSRCARVATTRSRSSERSCHQQPAVEVRLYRITSNCSGADRGRHPRLSRSPLRSASIMRGSNLTRPSRATDQSRGGLDSRARDRPLGVARWRPLTRGDRLRRRWRRDRFSGIGAAILRRRFDGHGCQRGGTDDERECDGHPDLQTVHGCLHLRTDAWTSQPWS